MNTILYDYCFFGIFFSMLGNLEGAISTEEMFPYGPGHGDSRLPSNDDSFIQVPFRAGEVLYFFNSSYSSLFINNNGGVSFARGNDIGFYTQVKKPTRLN